MHRDNADGVPEIPEHPEHPTGCWRRPGHHDCAIARIESLSDENVVRAFQERGAMIKNLTAMCARLERTIERQASHIEKLAQLAETLRGAA